MKNIYVCGPTVYSKVHIGNMRPIMTFDIFIRALKSSKENVNFIHNITDIDDKIIAAAQKEKITEKELSNKYQQHYNKMLKLANIKTISSMPTVTENIDQIIKFIEQLIVKKKAYEVNGNVYFNINSISGYGSVSKQKLEQQQVNENKDKKNAQDFVLWKKTNEGVQFKSPWSLGRPGWHTECVTFINNQLKGESLDIHGGGNDLMFPHHENENAQYLALNNKVVSKKWMHTGHINLDGEKMSKSIGNVWLAEDFFEKYNADVLRYIFLTSSPTAPINISKELIDSSTKIVAQLKRDFVQAKLLIDSSIKVDISEFVEGIKNWQFAKAMKGANSLIKDFRKNKNQNNAQTLISLMQIIGFNFSNIDINKEDKQLFKSWEKARKDHDWNKADSIRDQLQKKN